MKTLRIAIRLIGLLLLAVTAAATITIAAYLVLRETVPSARDPLLESMATEIARLGELVNAPANQAPPLIEPETPSTPVVEEMTQALGIPASAVLPRDGNLFQTPVPCQESFNEASSWLICEPGRILDNTAAWVIPSTKEAWYANVPEGGFTYFSMGEGVIAIDGISLVLPEEEGLNYLVVIRGRIDDAIVDSDLNMTAEVTDFVPGHAIWSIMPPGAYVSKDWFRDQLVVSTTTTGTNCGATGCSRTRIVLFDVDSHFYQMFETGSGDIDHWTLLEGN